MGEDAAAEMLWPPGEPAAMGAGEGVQIWCWSLHGENAAAEELLGELSAQERARAGRFVFRRDWRRYVMAHAGIRRVLGACVGRRGEEIVLGAGGYGKPYLVGKDDGPDRELGSRVEFNLSHAGNVAVLAVAWGMEVGVDVEEMREQPSGHLPVDQLSAREAAYLRSLPPERMSREFYRCWTGKEALLKGLGVGLSGGLQSFSVLPGAERVVVAGDANDAVKTLADWQVRELLPAVGYVGCLATPDGSMPVRCFRLG